MKRSALLGLAGFFVSFGMSGCVPMDQINSSPKDQIRQGRYEGSGNCVINYEADGQIGQEKFDGVQSIFINEEGYEGSYRGDPLDFESTLVGLAEVSKFDIRGHIEGIRKFPQSSANVVEEAGYIDRVYTETSSLPGSGEFTSTYSQVPGSDSVSARFDFSAVSDDGDVSFDGFCTGTLERTR